MRDFRDISSNLYKENLWRFEALIVRSVSSYDEYNSLMNAPLPDIGLWYFKKRCD